jgi:hypothetical protein
MRGMDAAPHRVWRYAVLAWAAPRRGLPPHRSPNLESQRESRFSGSLPDASIGRLSPDFDFHSRLSAHAMHDISSNLAGRRRVCLLHYSQRAIAGHAH